MKIRVSKRNHPEFGDLLNLGLKMENKDDLIDDTIKRVVRFFLEAKNSTAPFLRKTGVLSSEALFTLEMLQENLNNPLLTGEWCQVALKGQPINISDLSYWKNVQTKKLVFVDKQKINAAIRSGASVVLEGLDILDSRVNHLLRCIDRELPCALSNCVAFFSQAGNEAYSGHRDSDDVLVIQTEGCKHWRIYEPQQRRFFGNSPLSDSQLGPLADEFVMNPGDLMFIRAGVPHRCHTKNSYSLHLSIDLCDRTPNIEQITNLANQFYNAGCADPNLSVDDVISYYIERILRNPSFIQEIRSGSQSLSQQVREFRDRIDGARSIDALNALKKNPRSETGV